MMALAYFYVHQLFTVHILSVLLFSLPYYIIISSSIDHLLTYKRLEVSSLPLYSNFMLIKLQITTVNGITINILFMLSLHLSTYIYILVKFYNYYSFMVILQPNSPSNYEISQFRLWAPFKVVLTLLKVFLTSHLPTWCTRSSM